MSHFGQKGVFLAFATHDFAQDLMHLVNSSVKLLKLIIHVSYFFASGPCQMETSLFVAVGILNYSVSKMHVDNLAGIVQSQISAKVILAKGSCSLLLWSSVFSKHPFTCRILSSVSKCYFNSVNLYIPLSGCVLYSLLMLNW